MLKINPKIFFIKLILCLVIITQVYNQTKYCTPQEQCWPTQIEIQQLYDALEPNLTRILKWDGGKTPRVSAVPIQSPGDQPLYGLGTEQGLKPLYVQESGDLNGTCWQPLDTVFCKASIRNNPLESWTPAFVVWPLTNLHIQTAIKFATSHNLCIMVAGTGHDFLNRHSCNNGVFIRTSLMKNIDWDMSYNNGIGKVKFGPGIVFSEAHQSAALQDRYISSGWSTTVGVVGWAIGGGHGPFAPMAGLGVDNIVEIEIVTANSEILIVNETQNQNLFWALRGGGGSTWGVISSITYRAHLIPQGGFTSYQAIWEGKMCADGLTNRDQLIDKYVEWAQGLDNRWSGIVFFEAKPKEPNQIFQLCKANWKMYLLYMFHGSEKDPEFISSIKQISSKITPTQSKISTYANSWEFIQPKDLEPIIPLSWIPPSDNYLGGIPSVLVNRENVQNNKFSDQLKARLNDCIQKNICTTEQIYQDITGNINSHQEDNVSISLGFRKALFHWVVGPSDLSRLNTYYALGDNSYFSESAYNMDEGQWQKRYWGQNYQRLHTIKQLIDPNNVFWCHHCVGSEYSQKIKK